MLQVHGVRHRHAPAGVELVFPDIEVAAAETVVLAGPSGSGKSTLLALMAALLRLQAGTLRVGTADMAALSPRAGDAWRARELGFVPQRLQLSAGLSVADNLRLAYVATGERVDERRIVEVMGALGLHGLERRRPHALSVGQAQRVALARAVLRRPRVLLADEPTANLDDTACAAALDLLAGTAAAEAATLVIATHDQRVTAALPAARHWKLPRPAAPAAPPAAAATARAGDTCG